MTARRLGWVALLAGGKALVDAGVASWYFYQMPVHEKAWCIYCLTGQFASLGILALALPEARRALTTLRQR